MPANNRPYCELGKLIDLLARSRDVRGPYNIAQYVQERTDYSLSGAAVSKHLYGDSVPRRRFLVAFANAFELTEQERRELAWLYAYRTPLETHSA